MRIRMLGLLGLFAAFGGAVHAQSIDFAKAEFTTADLGHGIYVFNGADTNIIGAVGKDGVLLIDSEYPEMVAKLKAAVAKVTPLPIRFIVNTHFHGDHAGGNIIFGKEGVAIIGHENMRRRLDQDVNIGNGLRPRQPQVALPTVTYPGEGMSVHLDGITAVLHHPPPAHTDGDTYVYFPEANVIAAGDLYFSIRYPALDAGVGGGISGMIAACDAMMALADDKTKIVPGHGPIGDKKMLGEFCAMLNTTRSRLLTAIAAGKTEEQVLAENPIKDLDPKWRPPNGSVYLRNSYRSLKTP